LPQWEQAAQFTVFQAQPGDLIVRFGEWHCMGDREHQGLYHQYGGGCGVTACVRRRANQREPERTLQQRYAPAVPERN
jgi:hypothetical protein